MLTKGLERAKASRRLTAVFFSMSDAASKISVTTEVVALLRRAEAGRDGLLPFTSFTRALEGSNELVSGRSTGLTRGTVAFGNSILPICRSIGVTSSPFSRTVFCGRHSAKCTIDKLMMTTNGALRCMRTYIDSGTDVSLEKSLGAHGILRNKYLQASARRGK